MRKRTLSRFISLLVLGFVPALCAQSNAAVQYFYDDLGRTTALTYDSAGNTKSISRLSGTPNAVTTSFTYDPVFNKIASITDPLGHTTSFSYDTLGNFALNHANYIPAVCNADSFRFYGGGLADSQRITPQGCTDLMMSITATDQMVGHQMG